MRKFSFAFGLVCTVAAAAFLGACNKNSEKCSTDGACCKDKAAAAGAVKTDAMATPAADGKSCSGTCSGAKKTCPATGQSN